MTADDDGTGDGSGGSCSNGVVDGDETDVDCGGSCTACGDGQGCGSDDDCTSGWCDGSTCAMPSCDDAARNGNETDVDCGGSCGPCDDGAGCTAAEDCASGVCEAGSCSAPSCGDGVNNDDAETCDDGGESATCNADCTAAACGDGVINMAAGEACDEVVETAVCNLDCTMAECGDGVLNATALEECDDGGESATCDVDCTSPACGDGVQNVAAGEECDDAGESAGCNADCTAAACGDGLLNVTAGEECDDGDAIDDNLCSNACSFNECAFDVGLLPLMVHAGNHFGEIEFDGSCNLLVAGAFNGTLVKVTPAGVVSTFVASFGVSAVNGLAYREADDKVYVSTDGPAQLWSVTGAGVTSMVTAPPATFNAIAIAPPTFGAHAGKVIGAATDGTVYAVDPVTAGVAIVGSTGDLLSAITFNAAGTLAFVAQYNTGTVLAVSPAGVVMPIAASLNGPDGLDVDPTTGTIYVATTNGAPGISTIDPATGATAPFGAAALDGGYYVSGLRWEAGGNLLAKTLGANVEAFPIP